MKKILITDQKKKDRIQKAKDTAQFLKGKDVTKLNERELRELLLAIATILGLVDENGAIQ